MAIPTQPKSRFSLKPSGALALSAALLLFTPPAFANAAASSAGEKTARKEVLDASNYVGQVKAGYLAAKEVPEVCEKLFCYCGCDMTDCHGSLLDCFTSDHGVDCHICQEEAILALKFHRKGKSISDIQKFIDKRYAKEYPFETESPTLQKYKRERLWDNGKKAASKTTGEQNSEAGAEPKLKQGRTKSESCCGSDANKK
ncbi:hypothetical protein KF728_18600 [Candidatus Obscuribacterales bacterium]|nr:hypothetical protein [Candidatus Obscuribacterales bacterium]